MGLVGGHRCSNTPPHLFYVVIDNYCLPNTPSMLSISQARQQISEAYPAPLQRSQCFTAAWRFFSPLCFALHDRRIPLESFTPYLQVPLGLDSRRFTEVSHLLGMWMARSSNMYLSSFPRFLVPMISAVRHCPFLQRFLVRVTKK